MRMEAAVRPFRHSPRWRGRSQAQRLTLKNNSLLLKHQACAGAVHSTTVVQRSVAGEGAVCDKQCGTVISTDRAANACVIRYKACTVELEASPGEVYCASLQATRYIATMQGIHIKLNISAVSFTSVGRLNFVVGGKHMRLGSTTLTLELYLQCQHQSLDGDWTRFVSLPGLRSS